MSPRQPHGTREEKPLDDLQVALACPPQGAWPPGLLLHQLVRAWPGVPSLGSQGKGGPLGWQRPKEIGCPRPVSQASAILGHLHSHRAGVLGPSGASHPFRERAMGICMEVGGVWRVGVARRGWGAEAPSVCAPPCSARELCSHWPSEAWQGLAGPRAGLAPLLLEVPTAGLQKCGDTSRKGSDAGASQDQVREPRHSCLGVLRQLVPAECQSREPPTPGGRPGTSHLVQDLSFCRGSGWRPA